MNNSVSILEQMSGRNWTIYYGDSCEILQGIPDNTIHFSIFSPPFASLYTFSDSSRDLGNSKNADDFFEHFQFIVDELFRVLISGRLVSVHCMDIPAMKERDGYIGLIDFPGEIIRLFQACGFIYHSRVVIWKDPLIEATRTKALGLLHKQIVKNSSMCRNGLPDYLVTFRKPGDNPEPITHPDGFTRYIGDEEPLAISNYSHHVWRSYASPVWMDINQTDTLQRESAREDKDEKHICPLQLQVIERAIELWTNEGDVVLDPFAGIGSTGYVAVKTKRKHIGIELKKSYFEQAYQNCRASEDAAEQISLFELT